MMSSGVRWLSVVVLLAGAGESRCAEPPAAASPTVETVAQSPAAWLGKEVTLRGAIENEGSNYFTDLRVVLRDDEENALAVKPWLPISVPPGPPMRAARPRTLSQYLGKKVELIATLRHGELRHVGTTYYLEVREARTVD